MKPTVFYEVTPCSVVGKSRSCGGTSILYPSYLLASPYAPFLYHLSFFLRAFVIPWRQYQQAPPKRYIPTELHGVTFRKTIIF